MYIVKLLPLKTSRVNHSELFPFFLITAKVLRKSEKFNCNFFLSAANYEEF